MKKTLLKNGLIVDGTGTKAFRGDILFSDVILKVGEEISAEYADEIVDVENQIVAPGFIDPHSHADINVIENKNQSFYIRQGVTTEVVGLCGLGYVPLKKEDMIENMKYGAGLFGYKQEYNDYNFTSFNSYMKLADHAACNVAVSATHNAARIAATGFTNSPFEAEKRNQMMQDIIQEASSSGCLGISTGLSYYPCAYADYSELKALAEAVRETDGIFLMHIRYPKPEEPYSALQEIVKLGKECGTRIHILHYRTKYHLDGGHPEILLNMIRKANSEGADITMETLPYLSGSTYIDVILPGWVMEGGRKKALARLKDKKNWPEITKQMEYLLNITVLGNGRPSRFGHVGNHPEYSGRFILDVAKERNQDVRQMLLELLIDSELDMNYVGNERDESEEYKQVMMDDTLDLLMDPLYLCGSDTMPYGEYQHPRNYGCYPRLLRLARERRIPLEKMINKITWMPAQRLGLMDRGVLRVGKASDITVFDPNNVNDRANFDNPFLYPTGINYVFVNGVPAYRDGKETKRYSGTIVKKTRI